jgi:hypothetical protein
MRTAGGHRVVAAGRPGVTPAEPSYGEPGPSHGTVLGHCLERVRRAGGVISAYLPIKRADQEAICLQEPDDRILHATPPSGVERPSTRESARSKSAPSSSYDAVAEAGSALTTSTAEPGSELSRSRARCRSLRFTWFRVTALPTCLLTTNPTRAGSVPLPTARWSTTVVAPARWPRLIVSAKTGPEVSRFTEASTGQTARRLRPLVRREDRMARPARVRMRSRKPCVLARRRLFGWKVRLLTICSGYRRAASLGRPPGSGGSGRIRVLAGTQHPSTHDRPANGIGSAGGGQTGRSSLVSNLWTTACIHRQPLLASGGLEIPHG